MFSFLYQEVGARVSEGILNLQTCVINVLLWPLKIE
jgi:hypothetical protein